MSCIAPRCSAPREVGALFCATHLAAPPGKRGGWISAEKRRRARAASSEEPLEASCIVRRLWVGSAPPLDRPLPFDVLVLCAREIQPPQLGFRGRVIRVPLPDSALSDDELQLATRGARDLALELKAGRTALVTCRAGLNRSAFIAALALRMITKVDGAKVVEIMRERRAPAALHNPHFVAYLRAFQRS